MMKALHVQFQALTATFKMPFINTGVMIASPVPSYSNIVGIISCCKGSWIYQQETKIGFTYTYESVSKDLETTKRFGLNEKGVLKPNIQDGVVIRQFHINPILDIYLSNIELKKYFDLPVGVPTLGRSQDIAWITKNEVIEITEREEGRIKPTLIPFPCSHIGGRVVRYCDYYNYSRTGCVRRPTKPILYQIVPETDKGLYIKHQNLYAIDNHQDEVIYLHTLGEVVQ